MADKKDSGDSVQNDSPHSPSPTEIPSKFVITERGIADPNRAYESDEFGNVAAHPDHFITEKEGYARRVTPKIPGAIWQPPEKGGGKGK